MVTDAEFNEFKLETKAALDTLYQNQINSSEAFKDLSEGVNTFAGNVNRGFEEFGREVGKFIDETKRAVLDLDRNLTKDEADKNYIRADLAEVRRALHKLEETVEDMLDKMEEGW